MALQKNGVPAKLLDRINAGEEKTYSQWGKALGLNRKHVAVIVCNLRKKGHMIYPIGTINDPYNGNTEGILRNVLESKRYVSEIMHRSSKQEIPPRIKSIVKLMEEAILEYPDQYDEIESYISQIMIMAMSSKESLKEVKKHPEQHENNRITTK